MATDNVKHNVLSDEDDLPQAWSKVVAELEREANYRLDPEKAPSIEQVLIDINPAKADPTTKSKFKKVFPKALVCIDKCGGIIAGIGSTVFPASNQVYNAVSFLIRASQDSQAVFDNLAALMELLSAFLERLGDYLDRPEVELNKGVRRSVFRVMEQFITIMTLSYKLTGSWKADDRSVRAKFENFGRKTRNFVRVGIFSDDSGVKDATKKFQELVCQVTNAQIDDIHKTLSPAAKNICDLVEKVGVITSTVQESARQIQQSRSEEDDKKTREAVKKALGVEDSDADICSRAHGDFLDQIDGTGDWLFDRHDFRQWLDFRKFPDAEYSILGLQGPEGYGKSYLVHAIINHLQRKSKTEKPLSRMRVAWYYIRRESKRISLNQVLRNVIFQLATMDRAYMDYLKRTIGSYTISDRENTVMLWNDSIVQYSEKHSYSKEQPATAFFIILDGLNHAGTDMSSLSEILRLANNVNTDSENFLVRLLLSGDKELIKRAQASSSKSALAPIDLSPSSLSFDKLDQREDIEKFVSRGIDAMSIFQAPVAPDRATLRARILEKLPAGACGSYKVLEQKLSEIADSDDPVQMEDVLTRVDEDNTWAVKREIAYLNERLDGQHIRQLNEILAWVATAMKSPDEAMLRSVLSMTFHGNGLYEPIDYIRKHCSKLLDVNSKKEVYFVSTDVRDALRNAERTRHTIPEGEINVIQAMLKTNFRTTYGDYDIYDKFGFDGFFESKRNVQSDLIYLQDSEQENNLRLLKTCLEVICDQYDVARYEPLRMYASDYFDEHLTNVDPDKTPHDLKQQLSRRLYRMLREDHVIDIWAKDEFMWDMAEWFGQDHGFCGSLLKWMGHPEVQRSIQTFTTDWSWIAEITDGNAPREKLLQFVARRTLHRWYESDHPRPYLTFYWLRGYFQKTSKWAEEYETDTYWSKGSIDELGRWESWAKDELGIKHETARWYFAIAYTYHLMGQQIEPADNDFKRVACRKCDDAVRAEPGWWPPKVYKGVILFQMKHYQACIDHLEALVESNSMLMEEDEEYRKEYWHTIAPKIGDSHMRLGRLDSAVRWHRGTVDHVFDQDDFSANIDRSICVLIAANYEKREFDDALQLLRTLDDRVESGKSWLHRILESHDSEIHDQMLKLAHRSQAFHEIDAYYAKVMRDTAGLAVGTDSFLEFCRCKLLWYCGPPDSRNSVLARLEKLVDSTREDSSDLNYWTRRKAVKELAKSLRFMATYSSSDVCQQQDYLRRLRTLHGKASDLDRATLYLHVNLVQARLLHRSGEGVQARDLLRPEIQKAIRRVREEDSDPRGGYEMLAMILPVLDDDVNARAAWSLLEPNRDNNGIHEQAEVDNVTDDESADVQTETDTSSDSTQHTITDDRESADQDEPRRSTTNKLTGVLCYYCDGCSETNWEYADEMWVCKDCLDVQLDPACYQKLQYGFLDVTICSRSHDHLHIPPFDEHTWRSMDRTEMMVGAELRKRDEWLEEIERDWGLLTPGQGDVEHVPAGETNVSQPETTGPSEET